MDTSGDFRGSHLRRNRNIKSEAPHGTDDIHREILMNFTAQVVSEFALESKFRPCGASDLMQRFLTRILSP
ncbi:hypothetical protein GCM10008922_28690 [Faecalicatena contorta]